MKKYLSCALVAAAALTTPVFAAVTISSPGNGADVSSPFSLSADSSTCSGQPVSAMGYSLDSSSQTTTSSGTSIETQVSAGSGSHTLHVKSWGDKGASCVSDVAISVSGGVSDATVPSGAAHVSSIQTLGDWKAQYDSGTGSGSSNGQMSMTGSPSRSGNARRFVTNYSNSGGERYNVSFGDDTQSTNFFYDTWVYLDGSAAHIGNLELDMNQTMPNGQTAIFGFQCDGYTSTWDFTKNAGSAAHPNDTWVHSSQYCNPRSWGRNAWHHVQVSYARTDSGNITYHSVWLDGKEQPINATVFSAFDLGWGPTLLTNVQVDGLGAGGQVTVYLDDLVVSRW